MFFNILFILFILAGLFIILALAGLLRSFAQEFRRDRVLFLAYHRLLSKDDIARGIPDNERIFVCYAERFEEQMKYLSDNGYNAISLYNFVACVEGRKNLPDKPIIITFDDGFQSNYKYAYPVLKKYNLKATIFVTPDSESENFKVLKGIDCRLTDGQMKEMSNNGISIESHGVTHRLLTDLSEKEIEWELKESKSALEAITGKPVNFLAIPGGAYDKKVREIANRTGYKTVFGIKKGSNNLGSDLYDLRRIVVERDFSLADFDKILRPSSACRIRVIGWLKYSPRLLLGPERTIRFRNILYQSRVGSTLISSLQKFILWQK